MKVTGMNCGHCVSKIESALNEQTGVTDVDVNLDAGTVTVAYDEAKLTQDEITGAINEAGYQTEGIK